MTDLQEKRAPAQIDDTPDVMRFRVAAARRMLYRHGCDSGIGGHVSVRAADGDSFWVSPLQYFDETLPTDVIRIGLDMKMREGEWKASAAVAFHAGIYRARPDVKSIIHVHGDATAIFSTLHEPLGTYDFLGAVFHDDCAILEDASEIHSEADLHPFAAALGDKKALLMPNHGVIITSDSLQHCAVEAMIFERAARVHLEAKVVGGKEHPIEDVQRMKQNWVSLPIANEPWEVNVRRLRKSDPDLFEGIDPAVVAQAAWPGATSGFLVGENR